ncbi:MAG: class I tRNA ligase family protein [Candidatus Eisenbacteria bacterium]|nr:class I tRNA ligase family protein [Candidatus Eisenbacteria bacterium]
MTVYRQKDFSISRQRLWGTPIPIVLCETCGEVPVPVEELPVVAPGLTIDPGSGRLRREGDSWDLRRCPRCGAPARLDPQVMDCHMDSIWHPFRPCALESTEFLFDPDEVLYWMPADIIQFGRDVIPFMLDLRFFSYFLHDLGLVPFEEFCTEVLAHGLILHEGRKMSKHLGNAVTPEEAIERFGADALRFYALAHEEPKSDCRWSEEGIDRYRALLATFHGLVASAPAVERPAPPPATRDREPGARRSKYANVFLKKVAREIEGLASYVEETRYDRYASGVARMISSMEFFATNHLARERDPHVSRLWRSILEDAVAYLAPIAPHLAEECWEMLGKEDSIFSAARPPAVTAQAIRDLLEDSRHITTQGRDA